VTGPDAAGADDAAPPVLPPQAAATSNPAIASENERAT
jgi:hypothetical protein